MTFHDLSIVCVLSKCYIIIHRHLANCLRYPSHDTATSRPTSWRRALHHDIAVHPKSHSLLVQPVGLTVVKMYSVGKIYIRTPQTPPTPPSFLPPASEDPPPPAFLLSTVRTSGVLRHTKVNRHPSGYQETPTILFWSPFILDSKIADEPMAPPGIARRHLRKGK